MEQRQLFPLIRQKLLTLNAGYVRNPILTEENVDRYVVPPALGNRAGVLGALALTMSAR